MAGFTGGWGLALVDLDCGASVTARPEHGQYTASAGKIMIVIAALRAAEDGLLEFEAMRPHIEIVLEHSIDLNADAINDMVTPEQVAAVLMRAGVSEASRLPHSWRQAHFTPRDLARVWVSLVRGRQLGPERTAWLLGLAVANGLPDTFWPFPPDFGAEGYEYGQKAGYWTSPVPIGYRVSAGFARPADGSAEGYVFAFLAEAAPADLAGNWRRPVFPLVRDFIAGELERGP